MLLRDGFFKETTCCYEIIKRGLSDGWILGEAELGIPINLNDHELSKYSPVRLIPDEIAVVTEGLGKQSELNRLGIDWVGYRYPTNERISLAGDAATEFKLPIISQVYGELVREKVLFGKAMEGKTIYLGTDTTIVAFPYLSKARARLIDSSFDVWKRKAYLRDLFDSGEPIHCINTWLASSRGKSLNYIYLSFSILIDYNLDDKLYEACVKSLSEGSPLPLGSNLVDWPENIIDAIVCYNGINVGGKDRFLRINPVTKESLPLLKDVPRGVSRIALQLMGVDI